VNIQELEKQIEEQNRNGRTKIFIKKTDLEQLGVYKTSEKEEYTYIDYDFLQKLIEVYKQKNGFKNKLKVNIETKLTKIDEKGYHFEEIER
jgi:hypothetical protein